MAMYIYFPLHFEPLVREREREMERRERSWMYRELAPLAGMAAAECAAVGSNTVFKAATRTGQSISFYIFTLYTCSAAALLLLPFAFLFRRAVPLPSNKISFLLRLICLAAIGVSFQLLAYKGLEYSSPTLSSALNNIIPALTFILALLFRMEKIALKSISSKAKIIGAVVSISGALVVVLYKGPIVLSNPKSKSLGLIHYHSLGSSQSNWILGGLCFLGHNVLNCFWYILLTQMVHAYPDELVVVSLYYGIGAIICIPICLLAEGNFSAWRLKTGLEWIAVLNSGFLGQCFVSAVHTWGLHIKGPVYVSSFRPLAIAIAAATGVIFLADDLYLGSVIGAMIICAGFYAIMWGKAKEQEEEKLIKREIDNFSDLETTSSTAKTPLLQSYKF